MVIKRLSILQRTLLLPPFDGLALLLYILTAGAIAVLHILVQLLLLTLMQYGTTHKSILFCSSADAAKQGDC
jgi:hypothetical protein